MDATTNNPLGHLNNILLEISNSDNYFPYTVFASIFNLDANNKGSILTCYSELFKLCEDSRISINSIDVNHSKLLSSINEVILDLSKIEFTNPTSLKTVKNYLDDKTSYKFRYMF